MAIDVHEAIDLLKELADQRANKVVNLMADPEGETYLIKKYSRQMDALDFAVGALKALEEI